MFSPEWLETDGRGGFAMQRVDLLRTRRYHALLVHAITPPTNRVVLVNGIECFVDHDGESHAMLAHRFAPDVTAPDRTLPLMNFEAVPWPRWTFLLPAGGRLVHECFLLHDRSIAVLSWRLEESLSARLRVRPLISGRGPHTLQRENNAFRFDATVEGEAVRWQPYPNLPAIRARSSGKYRHAPLWYRQFEYDDERARGLDYLEDLATPGVFELDLASGVEAYLAFEAEDAQPQKRLPQPRMPKVLTLAVPEWRDSERARRRALPTPLARAGDAYIVAREGGKSIIAGYPWFSDWGRDTFVATRGLCLATGRWRDARDILLLWAASVSEGMLPNFFPEGAAAPEYNSVDASLWFIIAARDLITTSPNGMVKDSERAVLVNVMRAIVDAYLRGTRFGIRADSDGLLAAGVKGQQLTWMDARVDGREVTPRIGKPVEVQALWVNALEALADCDPARAIDARDRARVARIAFADRFWVSDRGFLADVVDVDHVRGTRDATLRPNQLFAIGGLPRPLIEGTRARRVVDVCEAELWTIAGPRSLAPSEAGCIARYEGGVAQRDAAYHMGAVWPWLAGAFIEGWVRVRGNTADAKREARERFLEPLVHHYGLSSVGQIGELADRDWPHRPVGCPFQAWSVGEVARISALLGTR